jgi:hypothetical protein
MLRDPFITDRAHLRSVLPGASTRQRHRADSRRHQNCEPNPPHGTLLRPFGHVTSSHGSPAECVPRASPAAIAPRRCACVRRCSPVSRALEGRPRRVLLFSAREAWPWSVWKNVPMSSGSLRGGCRAGPACVSARWPDLLLAPATPRRRVAPSTSRWQSLVSWNGRRACLLERGQSLPGRTLQLAWTAPSPRAHPAGRASASVVQARQISFAGDRRCINRTRLRSSDGFGAGGAQALAPWHLAPGT